MLEHKLGLGVRVDHPVHDSLLCADRGSARILRVVRPQEHLLVAPLREDLEDEIVVGAVRRSELSAVSASQHQL